MNKYKTIIKSKNDYPDFEKVFEANNINEAIKVAKNKYDYNFTEQNFCEIKN